MTTPGFRTQEIIVVTSLWDDVDYSRADLAELFRRRWHAELNLRSLKTVLQMKHLRCRETHRVRNELRMHFLAYNLIRQVMCEAAQRGGGKPWHVSFKGALTTLMELLPILDKVPADEWYETLLTSILRHVVGNHPDRFEPRLVKRRPKPYKLLQRPSTSRTPHGRLSCGGLSAIRQWPPNMVTAGGIFADYHGLSQQRK